VDAVPVTTAAGCAVEEKNDDYEERLRTNKEGSMASTFWAMPIAPS